MDEPQSGSDTPRLTVPGDEHHAGFCPTRRSSNRVRNAEFCFSKFCCERIAIRFVIAAGIWIVLSRLPAWTLPRRGTGPLPLRGLLRVPRHSVTERLRGRRPASADSDYFRAGYCGCCSGHCHDISMGTVGISMGDLLFTSLIKL